MPDPLLSVPVVAARLGVCEKTVRRLMSSGRLEYVRVSPRRVAIPASSVAAFLVASLRNGAATVPPTPEGDHNVR